MFLFLYDESVLNGFLRPQLDPEVGQIGAIVKRVRMAFDSGRTKSLDWRRSQIKAIQRMVCWRALCVFDVCLENLIKQSVPLGTPLGRLHFIMIRTTSCFFNLI